MRKMKTGVLRALVLGAWMSATALMMAPTADAQTVVKAVTSRSFGKDKPTGVTNVFTKKDLTVHAYVAFAKPVQCTMKSVWYAVKAKGLKANQKVYELSMKKDKYISGHFSLRNTSAWPVGTYRVDIYANSKKIRSLNFSFK